MARTTNFFNAGKYEQIHKDGLPRCMEPRDLMARIVKRLSTKPDRDTAAREKAEKLLTLSVTKGDGLSKSTSKRFHVSGLLSPASKKALPAVLSIPDTDKIPRYHLKAPLCSKSATMRTFFSPSNGAK